MHTQRLTGDAFPAWLHELDAFLLDCDGVLWRGDAAIPGATEAVALLRSLGKRVIFVTNASTKTREAFVHKLASQGIPAVVGDIVTSAWATAKYMKDQGLAGKVYVVGEAGLDAELRAEGFAPFGLEHSDVREIPVPFTVDQDVQAVVVGLDRNLCYYKLAYASCCVRGIPGCRFIATNPDTTFPQDGSILPGGGSVVKFVEAAVGHPPEVVIGKPSQYLLDTILHAYNLDPSRTCMVGDQLTTDIKLGRRGGLKTLLVLSGVTREDELAHIQDEMQVPDLYMDSMDDLSKLHAARSQSYCS